MRRLSRLLAPAAVALMLGGGQAKAQYTTIAVPGALGTGVEGVDGGNVVGYYDLAPGLPYYGFLYDGTTYTTLAPPGAVYSEATGISGGNVVGSYYGSDLITHGFLYQQSLPEPSGLFLLAIGIATTAGCLGLRRRRPSATARPGIGESSSGTRR